MTKKDLEGALDLYKDQVKFLKEQLEVALKEKENLRLQVEKLQDAVINIKAPEAYRDFKADTADVKSLSEEDIDRIKKMRKYESEYIQSIESPTFKSSEDMEDFLSTLITESSDQTPTSLHDNEES